MSLFGRAPRSGKSDNRIYGAEGERMAARHLKSLGAKILAQNYRVAEGEIDLIAEMDGYLCFVEVKRRGSDIYGAPAEAVDALKQRHIGYAAAHYLKEHGGLERKVRFDVCEVTDEGVRLIPGAFYPPKR
ncbi:MAG: YraN family protein [Clostridia bacterium]